MAASEQLAKALEYVHAYDKWQVQYALARLRGWIPAQQPPRPLHDAYLEMVTAQIELREALGIERLNYVAEARKEMNRARNET